MRFATSIMIGLIGVLFWSASAYADVIPPGSYQRTCHDFYTDGTTLSATCTTRWGVENYTTLRHYNDCEGDIANVDGRLRCIEDDDDHDQAPRGSYRATCRDISVEDGTLQAECRDRNGRWRYTELQNYRSCRGDIANVNGMLRCRRDDDDDADYDLPGGNWRYSCRNYRVIGWTLTAECRDQWGNWRRSTIDLRHCDGDVSNRRGQLVCAQSGGYGQIILYKDEGLVGRSRMYTTDVPDLNVYAFGNQVSSVVVQGGMWQLCDRPNYKGFCIVIDRSVSNLYVFGFNNRTESVRRIR
jgi:Beta/Gamma crystallin/CVNH domain